MRIVIEILLAAATAVAVLQQPAQPDPLIRENATVKVSEHVYVIPDFNVGAVPNVGIDGVLFAGDVVMNRRFLAFNAASSSVRAWISSIEKLAPLRPTRVVPSHGGMGDGSLLEQNRDYLSQLQTRATALKREGKTVDEASQLITDEIRARYPDWTGNPTAAARSAYIEAN